MGRWSPLRLMILVNFSSTVYNPFSPRASLIRYWNKHVSNNLLKPTLLHSVPLTRPSLPSSPPKLTLLSPRLLLFLGQLVLLLRFETKPWQSQPRRQLRRLFQRTFYQLWKIKTEWGRLVQELLQRVELGQGLVPAIQQPGNWSQRRIHKLRRRWKRSKCILWKLRVWRHWRSMYRVSGSPLMTRMGTTINSRFQATARTQNAGSQSFTSYGKKGNSVPSEFINYSSDSNIIDSTFAGYGELGNAANDSFTGYGKTGNNPRNVFKSYGIDSFSNYRNGANVGHDSFLSYARDANAEKVSFTNYGKSFNPGNDSFKEYGKEQKERPQSGSRRIVWIDPSRFTMTRDKMPPRSFLPRSIVSKLPFSTTGLQEVKAIFHAPDNSTMEGVILNSLAESERDPSRGETKRCVGLVQDMVDFAAFVFCHNIVVRTIENVNGSKKDVMIGQVKGINGGDLS
ncbi:hypothetical protein Tsubulata_032110, partial [Turnera subulata]